MAIGVLRCAQDDKAKERPLQVRMRPLWFECADSKPGSLSVLSLTAALAGRELSSVAPTTMSVSRAEVGAAIQPQ